MHSPSAPLAGMEVVITRPAGTAAALARRVRALGGVPRLLPGLSLRAVDEVSARQVWIDAQRCGRMIFTSPAAVRYALRLAPLNTRARVLAVGRGTQAALRRAGCSEAQCPPAGDERSEGVLAHPWLADVAGQRVALVTAPGGRDLLARRLQQRGARVQRIEVYRRVRPRLTRRHHDMLLALHDPAWLLVTSAQALDNLLAILAPSAVRRLLACHVVVSSERLRRHAGKAGFAHVVRAASPAAADLLAAVAGDAAPG